MSDQSIACGDTGPRAHHHNPLPSRLNLRTAAALLRLAGRPGVASSDRDRAMAAWIEAKLLCLSGYRAVVAAAEGRPSPAVWIQQLQWGLVNRRMFDLAGALRGPDAMLTGDA